MVKYIRLTLCKVQFPMRKEGRKWRLDRLICPALLSIRNQRQPGAVFTEAGNPTRYSSDHINILNSSSFLPFFHITTSALLISPSISLLSHLTHTHTHTHTHTLTSARLANMAPKIAIVYVRPPTPQYHSSYGGYRSRFQVIY